MPTHREYKAHMAPLTEKFRSTGFKVLVTNAILCHFLGSNKLDAPDNVDTAVHNTVQSVTTETFD